ncbi:error-prone DNA polymerase [Methylonatrum kenyense]|uniref:error-prone DNA polymerase n=1 Tax=Methylonatrum kenyense TaxID=455253 RepID=UPI0020BFAF3C|nr:error-prone DNA polymerase [Methylonatrum kenyense]MCK8516047.1 error-prone DNA polymerase [Methylonatrum kenyense]
MSYAELHCLSNFTFLRGASHPGELVRRAHALGYQALALTDECSLAGVVRAWRAARETGLKLIVGSELRLTDGPTLVLLAPDRAAYGQLCALITRARTRADKGRYRVFRDDLEQAVPACLALLVPGSTPDHASADWFARHFRGRGWIAVECFHGPDDAGHLQHLQQLAEELDLPLVAAGDVHMHRRGRRALQDSLSAVRLRKPLTALGLQLQSNGERHLRSLRHLRGLYPASLLQETLRIAERCRFRLDELRYEYPEELVPAGMTADAHLRCLVQAGARWRWPEGAPAVVRQQLARELNLIAELRYEAYFLTVHDIVRYARSRDILCQGRGSAANSAVCYCLGITEVDPATSQLLFERFISRARDEPPDIDVDFEHQRREEVIQYIYRKYGRQRAALAATVISYRPRSAIRDMGRALDLAEDQIERLSGNLNWWDDKGIDPERVREAGLDPQAPVVHRLLTLVRELVGFPRHLSQHVGGFVISRGPLSELVPVENAGMAKRTVIQWDKDDLEALGLLKVDVLALGMLSAIHRTLDLLAEHHGRHLTIADIPQQDEAVYRMLQRGDSMGVFQVESRAQMAMLPRLRPCRFYDLVIQVAIVRPGPIQGDMVHPYLRRRDGLEPISYPSDEVQHVLKRTLGVPIFQEQVMQLAQAAAGFSADEADHLRRSMAAWKMKGGLEHFEQRLRQGMAERGYSRAFADQIFRQIRGFGSYGFPESHAASFAKLVWVSAWLKHHYPAAFCCALLNSQPMGFYAPAQLVRDARQHGVTVLPVDVLHSRADCSLEQAGDNNRNPALRLGLNRVKGLSAEGIRALIDAREQATFYGIGDLAHRSQLSRRDLQALSEAGALHSLAADRRQSCWQVLAIEPDLPLLAASSQQVHEPALAPPSTGDNVVADYASLGLSLEAHPLALLRRTLRRRRLLCASDLQAMEHGRLVRTAGLVINRQRPGSAGGVTFVTLEDETGHINLVVWKRTAEAQRRILLGASLLGVSGTWERRGEVCHLVAGKLEDHSELLGRLQTRSRDFR